MANIKDDFIPKTSTNSPKQILQDFAKKHHEWKPNQNLVDFLRDHLFFLSVTFKLHRVSGWRTDFTKVIGEFDQLYFKTSKRLVGNNLGRKRRLQPLAYAFIDFEGSRHLETPSYEILKSQFPHVHALALVRPEHASSFVETIQMQRFTMGTIQGCEVRRYDTNKKSVEDLVEYCAKGWNLIPNGYFLKTDLWNYYPRVTWSPKTAQIFSI